MGLLYHICCSYCVDFLCLVLGVVVIACPDSFGNHLAQIRESQRQGSKTLFMLKSSKHESILLINIKTCQQLAF